MNAKEKLTDLQRQFGLYGEAAPQVMEAFGGMCGAAMAGPLEPKMMELLIVTAAIARKCEPCIYAHIASFIEAGGTREELVAGINAAFLICGGPGMAYGALALDIFDQYTA